jgi:hypothetical protein
MDGYVNFIYIPFPSSGIRQERVLDITKSYSGIYKKVLFISVIVMTLRTGACFL